MPTKEPSKWARKFAGDNSLKVWSIPELLDRAAGEVARAAFAECAVYLGGQRDEFVARVRARLEA